MSNTNAILRGRISYAHIFEPHAVEAGQDPQYALSLIIPTDGDSTPFVMFETNWAVFSMDTLHLLFSRNRNAFMVSS